MLCAKSLLYLETSFSSPTFLSFVPALFSKGENRMMKKIFTQLLLVTTPLLAYVEQLPEQKMTSNSLAINHLEDRKADCCERGPRGLRGEPGIPGADGATGAEGATGAPGATGPTGDTGATGAIGATGATGPIGETGAPGATGEKGEVGARGQIGPRGPEGSLNANNIWIVSTATSTVGGMHLIPLQTVPGGASPIGFTFDPKTFKAKYVGTTSGLFQIHFFVNPTSTALSSIILVINDIHRPSTQNETQLPGQTNYSQAIFALNPGDTIAISNASPHVLPITSGVAGRSASLLICQIH